MEKLPDWKYNHYTEQLRKTSYKVHENFIINSLFHNNDFIDLLPLTQYYVKRKDEGYALIDLYYPQLNLAIEIDEPHHLNIKYDDKKRQKNVEKQIDCVFERIKISEGNIQEQLVGLVNKINALKNEIKTKIKSWDEPIKKSITDMKKNFKNTMFIKIKGIIKPEELMSRQTGYWKIEKPKLEKIHNIIIVHDGIIVREFGKPESWSFINNKYGFIANEVEKSTLTGTIVTDWNYQKTNIYSNDVY